MKITEEELSELGLYRYPKREHLFGDWENIEFNKKTNELFYHNCMDGSVELYRRVKNFEDLTQALYDGFDLDFLV
tara:strand:- start:178 stop:402 length:225 start_codon:yes stop_codon:yes gene_type:complete